MSAYSDRGKSQVIPLPGATGSIVSDGIDRLPPLPQISVELENFFRTARQFESLLTQERNERKNLQAQLQDLHQKYERISSELDSKLQEAHKREEQLKTQISSLEEKQKEYPKVRAALIQEQNNRKKYQQHIQALQNHYTQLAAEAQNRIKNSSIMNEHLKSQLQLHQQNEKLLQEQIKELLNQLEIFRDQRKKTELDIELLKANLQHARQREESVQASLKSSQSSENSRLNQIEQLKRDLNLAHEHLQRYKSAWGQTDRQAKQAIFDSVEAKKKLTELSEALSAEKRRFENLEELLKKEKREKQLALSCLHTAESQLVQLSRTVDEIKEKQGDDFKNEGMNLKF